MPAATNPTFIAGGTIYPSRFVTMYTALYSSTSTPTAADFTVWQATNGTANAKGDRVIGISQEGTDLWSSNTAATANEQVRIFGPGEIGLVEVGATVTAGDWVKSDANGRAITAANTGDQCAGLALQTGNVSGSNYTKIQVYIHPTSFATP